MRRKVAAFLILTLLSCSNRESKPTSMASDSFDSLQVEILKGDTADTIFDKLPK